MSAIHFEKSLRNHDINAIVISIFSELLEMREENGKLEGTIASLKYSLFSRRLFFKLFQIYDFDTIFALQSFYHIVLYNVLKFKKYFLLSSFILIFREEISSLQRQVKKVKLTLYQLIKNRKMF